MPNLKDRLRRIPLPLLLALVVAVGASVIMVVQITVLPAPPAIVAPVNTAASVLTSGSQTVTIAVTAYAGQTVVHSNLAALGRVLLQANTTGWHYQVNDWIYTVVRRATGNATFTLPTGVTVEVFQYNSSHALVVNRQRNTVLITKIVSVGTTGWYAYHPVDTVYDSGTVSGLTRFMSYRGLTQVNVFRPRTDYVTFDPYAKVFRVYFDVVSSSGSVTPKGTSLTNSSNFAVLAANTPVVPTNYFIIDINNVVLPPIWVIYRSNPTANINSALTVSPQPPP
jgi:hypothetical protein